MDLWGEIEDSPIDTKSQQLLLNSTPKIVNPSEFELHDQQRFQANPLLVKHHSTDYIIGSSSSNEITSPNYNSVAQSMRESIIMILTHVGFDLSHDLTIDLLVDVLEYYLKSFGKLLRSFTDSIDLQSPNDFYDIMDKTLHHMNVPNFESLRKFHEELVENYNRVKTENSFEENIQKMSCQGTKTAETK
ncbi:hypothetical protein HUG17_7108 [Dermatophagoides farinae]|uniref:Bromodomain associated domain-containing protein n=1 Tax=Dermatophagoides farinae TaxID=6954 RepID=A0A9D4NS56_DERFA|nr:hypothetical protein HUG17_7108 [Dermatophagoides farinae]